MVGGIRFAVSLSLACISLTAYGDFADSFQPYKAALDHYCLAKHLDLMTPADLNDRIVPFLRSLPAADRITVTVH
jgi:hypothetical protein